MSEKLSIEQRVGALEAKVAVISTGLNAILTELAKVGEAEGSYKQRPWNPTQIKWEEAEGTKGKYERSDDVNNRDHKALVKDLAKHKGTLTHGAHFYWLFTNGTTIGRKPRSNIQRKK